jgi:outer membrane protein TolC
MAKKKQQFIVKHCKISIIVLAVVFPTIIFGQPKADSLLSHATLENCIHYALKNNPAIKNSVINEAIVETTIKSKLSEWYPQLSFTYNLQDNFQLSEINIDGNLIKSGTNGTSSGQFGLTQNIFSSDALLASRSAKDVRIQAKQSTKEQNINN